MKLNFLLCFIILIAALYVSETYEINEGFEENNIANLFLVGIFAFLIGGVGGFSLGINMCDNSNKTATVIPTVNAKPNNKPM